MRSRAACRGEGRVSGGGLTPPSLCPLPHPGGRPQPRLRPEDGVGHPDTLSVGPTGAACKHVNSGPVRRGTADEVLGSNPLQEPSVNLSPALPLSDRRVGLGLLLWLTAAFALSGPLSRGPAPLVPASVWVSVFAVLLLWRRSLALQAWTARVDLRVPILWHTVRVVFGALFLLLAARGELPGRFAYAAGWGDIVAGALALPAAWAVGHPGARRWVLAWNALGLADILFVVLNAARFFLTERESMLAFTQLPYRLLPLFIVPLVILSHLLVFRRLRARAT